MTRREKIMVGAAGGAILLFAGVQLVRTQVIAPVRALQMDLQNARQRHAALQQRLSMAPSTRQRWMQVTAQTLGSDPVAAQALFRRDLTTLLERHGLVTDLSVKSLQVRTVPRGLRAGFAEVPVAVHVRGTLDTLVGFLRDFYQRPYLARISRLALAAETGTPGTGPGRPASDNPVLTINFTATALVLPVVPDAPHQPVDLNASAARPLLDNPDPTAYEQIVASNVFRQWRPPPPQPPPPTEPPPTHASGPPPPPPRADWLVLVGTTGMDNVGVAYVRNPQAKDQPPTQHRVGERIDDGTLVLVHPLGMVVRVDPQPPGSGAPIDYFYPLGAAFKERVPLDPAVHPEVARELRLTRGP